MDQPKRLNIDYSLENIPIPSADSYKRRLIEKVESVIRRMRWKSFFFLKGSEEVEDEGQENNNYGFKTKAYPPQVEELKPFENDLLRMVEGISFRNMSDSFQVKMKADIKDIRNSKEVIVRADKTRNLYRVEQDHYSKLLRDNVTKHYKTAPEHLYDDINCEAKSIAKRLNIDDRMETLAKTDAFLTLKDHKENFASNLPCRLINLAKPDMGRVSKQILDDIINKVRESTAVHLWKNTASVIDWFKAIPEKEDNTFICFDIVEYYPSISEKLLRNALSYASQFVDIPKTI